MTEIHPVHRIASTSELDDLRPIVEAAAPFLTVAMPTSSRHQDAAARKDTVWRNARRAADQAGWPATLLGDLDDHVAGIDHRDAEAVVVIQSSDGVVFTELLTLGIDESRVSVGDVPSLVPVIEHRQRTLPHLVVVADRAGADVIAFDGGEVVESEGVEGETLHIHRGHPGGWSQRRFQQRAENTWEQNADDVVDVVARLAARVRPALVAVAGEVRATSLIVDGLAAVDLPGHPQVVGLESGDPDGIAEETLRQLADLHARMQRDVLDELRSSSAAIVTAGEVEEACAAGRVETLVANDRAGGTVVDRCVAAALRTSAAIVVAPTTPELRDGVAAIARW